MGSIVWLVLVGSGFSNAETWTPTADLVVGAGHEDDLVLYDQPEARIVPGGAFGEFRAMTLLSMQQDDHGHLRIGAHGTWQHFLESNGRRLASAALFSEFRHPIADRWHVVFGARGGGYDDDSRLEVRRFDGAVHGALGISGRSWTLDAGMTADGVRLPELPILLSSGEVKPLTESALSVHTTLLLRLGRTAYSRLDLRRREADAVDPFYDSTTLIFDLTMWVPLGRHGRLSFGAGERDRDYTGRTAGFDSDRWRHLGLGYEHALSPRWRLMVKAGAGEYRGTSGQITDSRRATVAIGWRPWSRTPPPARPALPPLPRAGEPILFRCHAPDATTVALIGEFNGWNPSADPLAPAGGGWWETLRPLEAGSWQYTYLVDGMAVTPTDAEILVPDGFGSQNGLIAVRPQLVTSYEDGRLINQRPDDEPSDGPGEDQE